MFGLKRRLVRRWECEMAWPKPGPLPQTSQVAATGTNSSGRTRGGPTAPEERVTGARDGLEAAREEIDELNVSPVPDGDTGTNLHLTVAAAAEALTDRSFV